MKFIIVMFLLVISSNVMAAQLAELNIADVTECATIATVYGSAVDVISDKTNKTPQDALKALTTKYSNADEKNLSEILYHTYNMIKIGWNHDRIFGFIEGRCIGYTAKAKESESNKTKPIPAPVPQPYDKKVDV